MAAYQFGPFLLDSVKRSLLRDGVPQSLTPKAFDLLLLLVERRQRVLSKDELMAALWPDAVVEEANLTQQTFVLRRMLNGDSAEAEYIATIPRRGYRFVAEVTEQAEGPVLLAKPVSQPPARRLTPRWLLSLLAGVMVFGAALLLWVLRRSPSDDSGPRIITVTALPGLEASPSISPDGNFVVFSWTGPDHEGISDLWIKAVDSDALQRLTETPAAESWPAWSPDGREVAFIRSGHGVFIISQLGGSERKVADSGSMVAWTPDGESLLVRDRVGESPYSIFKIDIGNGHRSQLTRALFGMGDWTFDVSPDGGKIAFIRTERPGVSDVYTVPIEGGQAQRRTNWNADMSRVVWLPDGRDILFAVNEAPGIAQNLFRIPADGDRLDRGSRALHVSMSSPSISRLRPDGSARLAFAMGRTDVGMRLVDLQGLRREDAGSVTRFSNSTRIDVPGRFSRNGEQIAFVSDRNGWAEVWVANRNGSGYAK